MIEISLDVEKIVQRGSERILEIFGEDEFTKTLKKRIERILNDGLHNSRTIQSIGMNRPIPIENVYQPSHLSPDEISTHKSKKYKFDELVDFPESLIIQGAPGAGKTILAHRLFLEFSRLEQYSPFLFTLRNPESMGDLEALIGASRRLKKTPNARNDIIWIVDGYDEINRVERKKLSRILVHLTGQGLGRFILTCRSHYDVIDLKARYLFVQPFSKTEATKYITSFCAAYGANIDVSAFSDELSERGFDDFLSSPLMLTLACIMKTSPTQTLPRHTLGLVRKALDVLTFRWDESRGVAREATENIDGEDRIKCLKRVAFQFSNPYGSEEVAISATREQLKLLQRRDISPQKLLRETAQWYGVFVPASEGHWTFAHKTIHDYLAAQHWIDSGAFHQGITIKEWNTRVAYAACLLQDSTRILIAAIQRAEGFEVLIECMLNGASFDAEHIVSALARKFSTFKNKGGSLPALYIEREEGSCSISTKGDFCRHASSDFLIAMIEYSCDPAAINRDAVYGVAMSEIIFRKKVPIIKTAKDLDEIHFDIERGGGFKMRFCNKEEIR